MSFRIDLAKNLSDANALDKELTNIRSYTGTLRDASSIIDPIIRMEIDAGEISQYNYMVIPIFNRKYFIKDITSESNNLVIIRAHVDVLSSYADEIRTNTGVIARQENKYNLFIDDNLFKIDSRTIVQVKDFTGGGAFQKTPTFCLVTVG